MEIRYLQKQAEEESEGYIESVGQAYRDISGSRHVGMIESYECRDAEVIVATMGIVYPVVKFIVKSLRQKGVRIGCIKIRTFRPFPAKLVVDEVRDTKLIITLDRNSIAALFHEIGAAMHRHVDTGASGPLHMGKVIGVGGMPITFDLISGIVEQGFETLEQGRVEKDLEWLPIKGTTYDPTLHVLAE
jgi:pyruvate ferredoxin oxidoreductase alpha subunit